MELRILEERPNPLLKRTEYRFEVVHAEAPTPTIEDVRTELAKQVKVPKDRLVVEGMHARYGAPQTVGEALAYQTKEALLATSREHILFRNKLKEKTAPAAPGEGGAAPAAAPEAPAKAEKPAEKPAETKPSAEKAHADKPPADKPHAEKSHPEKPHAEKGPADKGHAEKGGSAEKQAGEKSHSEKAAGEKPHADKPKAEKPAKKE